MKVNSLYRKDTRKTNSSHRKKAYIKICSNHVLCPICGLDLIQDEEFELSHTVPFWKTRDAGKHDLVATHKTCNQHFPDNETLKIDGFKRHQLAIVKVN